MGVAVIFEMSGTVRDAFISRGHNAISCDLQLCDKPGPRFWGSVYDFFRQYDSRGFDLIVCHPPCTYLANVGAKYFYGKRARSRSDSIIEAANLFNYCLRLGCKRKAIENPKMYYRSLALVDRPPDQVIQPYFFGDPFSKYTCLWLDGLPKLEPTKIVDPVSSWVEDNRSPIVRSVTFPGIAGAMADQWGIL